MHQSSIDHAFEHVKLTCDKRLADLYPQKIPADIRTRYEQELSFLEKSDYIDDFEILRCLTAEIEKSATLITVRGTLSGSLLYYLLNKQSFNPLPVHYYCSACGHYEAVQTRLFGIDLPPKSCPVCGKELFAEGFNLSAESVWGTDGKKLITFDYNVNSEFLPFAHRMLKHLYPANQVIPLGVFEMENATTSPYMYTKAVGICPSGYAILPTGCTIEDYPDLSSCLENGDPCITGNPWELEQSQIRSVKLYPLPDLEKLIQLQRLTGVYAAELSTEKLREITWSNLFYSTLCNYTTSQLLHELRPRTFKDIIACEACSHSTMTCQNETDFNIYKYLQETSSSAFQTYPCYTREDFYDYMIEAGIEKETAFRAAELIRKGSGPSTGRYHDDLFALPIPELLLEVASKYRYLFPRAHCVDFILLYAKIAYYAKIDSRAFSKVVFKK